MKPFRKNRRPGNRRMTDAESDRMARVKGQCIACYIKGIRYEDGAGCEGNHMKSGNIRISHAHSYGLCQWHHKRWLIVDGWSFAKHREELGPSLLDGSATFHAYFGSDAELLAIQNELIGTETPPTELLGE